jgi:hypothetical protein
MQRDVRAYEKPSRIAQGLVVCLSIAVVLAAGRLASTIIFSHYATASAVDNTNRTSAPASVESVPSEPHEPPVAARVNPAKFEPLPRDDASTAPTPPPSALPLAPLAEPPSAATRYPGFAPWSTVTAAPDVDFRSSPAKRPPPDPPLQALEGRVGPSSEATGAIVDLLRAPPLPSSAPPQAAEGRVASIPVPRPRPRPESEDVQPEPDQSPFSAFDLFIDRRR